MILDKKIYILGLAILLVVGGFLIWQNRSLMHEKSSLKIGSYSIAGKVVKLSNNEISLDIMVDSVYDEISKLENQLKVIKINSATIFYKVSHTTDGAYNLESATLSDIEVGDEIIVNSYQDPSILYEIIAEEIDIKP